MAVRRICVEEVTTVSQTDSITITCLNPPQTPVGQGTPSEQIVWIRNLAFNLEPLPTISFSYDVQLKFAYHYQGNTMEAFCDVFDQSYSVTFDSNLTVCSGLTPSITYSVTYDPTAITTGQSPSSVTGYATISFTIDNLCAYTTICIEDTTCL